LISTDLATAGTVDRSRRCGSNRSGGWPSTGAE
jgi:hypothetical protein